ncbi:WAK2-OsWAK receptor-like cytoplasmic kinase (OsWAK-RLCK) [Zea mays]|uniref:WAK2-OsWAK receptor-like cytoplasmic kinase (OsWAK-RLCK) n=1 Tax=Zea mays TaxID=4577 RepID=A0A1D6MLU4_MAIZE|nr:WAK2-OsWAK receptor-like cytoplasmic kinase (OsWAK-RLCK) [Zea mays]
MQTTAVVAAALLLLLSAFPRLGSATAAAADTNTNTNQTTSGGNGTGCAPARCGGLTITYPFSLVGAHPIYCGFPAFQLTCDAAANRTYLSRTFRDRLYRVLHIFYGNSSLVMAVQATFAGDGGCRVPDFNVSASLALLPVYISAANRNLTFVYGCDVPPRLRLQPACDNTTMGAYTSDDDTTEPLGSINCSSVSVPVRWIERGTEPGRRLNYSELIGEGFLLEWPPRSTAECDECKERGGECRFPDISFQCICRDGRPCRRSRGTLALGIKIGAGTLRDGNVVAVKRLYKNSYKSVEQFQNEVEILSRLRHPNLVTLYGCTSPRSSHDLLLVYEYVPNGTLADHLHGARASSATGSAAPPLSWPVRLGIAVETASALDYLHAVEPHQVVHRDVKTNNILLDEAFHVKVADFGLSRLFPAHATHVSTAPQGTPGYVDPMYHQCYQLTDKSDVYSFGVVLVELISSKPAVDMSRAGGDVNLASMAVHMIQCYEIDRLVDPRIGYRTDGGTKRAVDLVAEMAFRCLQPEQDVRPPISEVLGALREAQRMEQDGCAKAKDDMGLLKKSRDGSPDSVMYQWTSPSTTTHNSS